ncbi:MAG: calcium/sodium antiporter [Planctomycetota bacterium]
MDVSTLLLLVGGLLVLVAGAEALVRGAASLAVARGVSPLVVGLTIVAFGTSAPEMTVSVAAALEGKADVAYGNVVGSNIFNVLLILGVCAALTPLVVARQLVRVDVPVMVGVSLLGWLLAADGRVSRVEGGLLVLGLAGYVLLQLRLARNGAAGVEVEEARGPRSLGLQLLFIAVGLGLLVLGSGWFVDGAVRVARALGVSDLVVGLTIVAAGTSAPEVATSIVATLRGQRDIAVGNVVGSNVFNLLGVLGVSSAVAPGGVAVPDAALAFDTPYMVAVAAACLPIFFTGHRIARWEGWLFLVAYGAYTAYLVLAATRHDALHGFSWVAFEFVAPLVGITLGVLGVRALRAARRDAAGPAAPPGP